MRLSRQTIDIFIQYTLWETIWLLLDTLHIFFYWIYGVIHGSGSKGYIQQLDKNFCGLNYFYNKLKLFLPIN